MKNFVFTVLFFALLFTMKVYSQQDNQDRQKGLQKIEQLEKIKLIEALNLDDATSTKFFVRKKDFNQKRKQYIEQIDNLTDQIEQGIKSGKLSADDPAYSKMIDEYIGVDQDFLRLRADFISSLKDILSEEQIAKYIVFEKKFREEIQDLILKHRKNMKDE
jgi:hypothetical protein